MCVWSAAGPGLTVPIIDGPVAIDQTGILASLNADRALNSALPLVWDADAAAFAATYVSTCPGNGSSLVPINNAQYGGTLALGLPDFKSVVLAWYNEGGGYDFTDPGYDPDAANFTQVRAAAGTIAHASCWHS
jgi:hypothetical protein